MKTVVVASTNPVKAQAVRLGFERMFDGEQFSYHLVLTPSGISDQPVSDQETLLGAMNRAQAASLQLPKADFWVGVEGGVENHSNEMSAFAWVVVKSGVQYGKARSGAFFLPAAVVDLIRQGKELGESDDLIFGRANSKLENGAIGLLTGDVIDRAQLYAQTVVMALIPFKNPDLYPPQTT
jgi:inosine/xanthosine triphosphatase